MRQRRANRGDIAIQARWRRNLSKVGYLLAGGIVLLGSCSDSASNRATVNGTVALDGQPIESGSIDFFPVEGTRGPTAGGTIEGGRYRIESAKGAAIGKNRVEIHGMRKTGKSVADPFGRATQIAQVVEIVPPQYHSNSTLVRDVASGENELNFDLKSKP